MPWGPLRSYGRSLRGLEQGPELRRGVAPKFVGASASQGSDMDESRCTISLATWFHQVRLRSVVVAVCMAPNDVESREVDVNGGVYGRVVSVVGVCGGDAADVCNEGHASSRVVGGRGVGPVGSGEERRGAPASRFLKHEDVG